MLLAECKAAVLTARFSPYQPNLIIGGSYTGQLLVWDMRAKSLPVDKTTLTSAGHTHPVSQLEIIGTANAHNVVSTSTDGLFCAWSLDMLAKPQEVLELAHTQNRNSVEVAVTTFGFPENETTLFAVGTEEGNIYQANRADRAGTYVLSLYFYFFFESIFFIARQGSTRSTRTRATLAPSPASTITRPRA